MDLSTLQAALDGRCQVTKERPELLTTRWRFAGAGGATEQRVWVSVDADRGWLVLCSEVGPVDGIGHLTPESALQHNATLGVGALALHEGVYFLREVLPLGGRDSEAVCRAIGLVAHEAARLRVRPVCSRERSAIEQLFAEFSA